ncbi:nucleotidyltransferase [Candidatus Wolfebacteria bacterium RIFCSPLOWO2_01_FULL_38_11]|uniref:Polymerase beta domain protein region protein n=2 Tax=Candidatus Wolfeibacteriota TaxID=1752735 RepID=A0A0G0FVD8_9BACT|nr:MAG: polymerase beta domain protein region protein [Candidatus Wolfebacteria bacterium GW2011_GWC1_37_10]OGM91831.1 MAG: nucleotidyltransferase [Candidatus Wolfebacteria bacterium RIFCSPLOWO2_01_FULL_38_11]
MITLAEIKNILLQNMEDLEEKFFVKELAIFGSYVRNEQNERSDVDILVDFKEPIGFFKFIELENHLSNLLGIKVDLVTKKALKPIMGKQIIQESVKV